MLDMLYVNSVSATNGKTDLFFFGKICSLTFSTSHVYICHFNVFVVFAVVVMG